MLLCSRDKNTFLNFRLDTQLRFMFYSCFFDPVASGQPSGCTSYQCGSRHSLTYKSLRCLAWTFNPVSTGSFGNPPSQATLSRALAHTKHICPLLPSVIPKAHSQPVLSIHPAYTHNFSVYLSIYLLISFPPNKIGDQGAQAVYQRHFALQLSLSFPSSPSTPAPGPCLSSPT